MLSVKLNTVYNSGEGMSPGDTWLVAFQLHALQIRPNL